MDINHRKMHEILQPILAGLSPPRKSGRSPGSSAQKPKNVEESATAGAPPAALACLLGTLERESMLMTAA